MHICLQQERGEGELDSRTKRLATSLCNKQLHLAWLRVVLVVVCPGMPGCIIIFCHHYILVDCNRDGVGLVSFLLLLFISSTFLLGFFRFCCCCCCFLWLWFSRGNYKRSQRERELQTQTDNSYASEMSGQYLRQGRE